MFLLKIKHLSVYSVEPIHLHIYTTTYTVYYY